MVAYMEKSAENADFAEIVDFLNVNPIRQGKDFSGRVTPLFKTMLIQHPAEVGEDETVYEEKGDRVERAATTATSLDAEQDSGGSPRHQDTILGDIPAQTRVLALENTKTAQDLEITYLKKRFKRLKKKRKSRAQLLKRRLFKVRIESSAEKSLEIQGRYGYDVEINTASTSITTASINITTVEPVTTVSAPITTAGVSVSTAEPSTPPTTTPTIIEDEDLIIAQTLMKMRSKGKMVEPEKPLKKKVQIELDEKVARNLKAQLQAELEKEERNARQKEEDANIALIAEWDDVQAMIDAYHKLAERLQAEEQGELTIKERSKLFVELLNERKKHFTRLRAEEKRRKLPTKAQKMNQMCTYLKNMACFTHYQLKNKNFEEVQ
nr:hypothetical protein [Tanacetum cinerariifolium]